MSTFWLADWEYDCCAPHRKVGEFVSIDVVPYDAQLWEERHRYPDDPPAQVLRGHVEAIYWHPRTYEHSGERGWEVSGHGPAVRIYDTEKNPTRLDRLRRSQQMKERLKQWTERNQDRRNQGRQGWVSYRSVDNPAPPEGYDLEFVIRLDS